MAQNNGDITPRVLSGDELSFYKKALGQKDL
jgi:hypothetical protein